MHDKMCLEYKKQAHKYRKNIFPCDYDILSQCLGYLQGGKDLNYCPGFKDHVKQVLDFGYDLKTLVFSSEGESPNQHTVVILPCCSSWHKKSLIIAWRVNPQGERNLFHHLFISGTNYRWILRYSFENGDVTWNLSVAAKKI